MSLDEKQRLGVVTPPSKLPYVVAVLLVIVAIGALAWYFLGRKSPDASASVNTVNAAAAPAPATAGRGELLPSGLRIETIRAGTGPLITRADAVLVRYERRVPGGPVLDGNMDAPEGMGMSLNRVIPGFAEGLTHMRPGGIARLWVPPQIGYGPNLPPGAPFGPTDTLEFLIRIEQVAPGRGAELEAGAFPARPSNGSQTAAEPARR